MRRFMSLRESAGSRRMPFQGSQHSSNRTAKSFDRDTYKDEIRKDLLIEDDSTPKEKAECDSIHLTCLLSVRNGGAHSGSYAHEDALLNRSIFPPGTVKQGDRIQLTAFETESPPEGLQHHGPKQRNSTSRRRPSGMHDIPITSYVRLVTVVLARTRKVAQKPYYVFTVKDMSAELSLKYPNLQVCSLF